MKKGKKVQPSEENIPTAEEVKAAQESGIDVRALTAEMEVAHAIHVLTEVLSPFYWQNFPVNHNRIRQSLTDLLKRLAVSQETITLLSPGPDQPEGRRT